MIQEYAGLIIVIALVAALVCGKAGSFLGAMFFLALALVTFISTPAGADLPSALAHFFQSINDATSPALQGSDGARAEE